MRARLLRCSEFRPGGYELTLVHLHQICRGYPGYPVELEVSPTFAEPRSYWVSLCSSTAESDVGDVSRRSQELRNRQRLLRGGRLTKEQQLPDSRGYRLSRTSRCATAKVEKSIFFA